jgi:hypothetical protein
MTHWLLIIGVSYLAAVCGFAQERPRRSLPPTTEEVITGPEWAAREARLGELRATIRGLEAEAEATRARGGDATTIERELAAKEAEKTAEFDDMGRVQDPAYYAAADLVREHWQRLRPLVQDLQTRDPLPLDDAKARYMLDELYVDLGVPSANGVWASTVLMAIHTRFDVELPTPESTRRILRDGLLEYIEAGGGRTSPLTENGLAYVLLQCSSPEDDAATEAAFELRADAQAWTEELQSPALYVKALKRYSDVVEKRIALRAGTSGQRQANGGGVAERGEPSDRAALAERDVGSLRALVFRADGSRVDEAQLRRVLRACQAILDARGASPTVCAQGEHLLIEIARAQLLETTRVWQLWAEAAGALRERASRALREFTAELAAKETRAPVQRALRRALTAFGRAERWPSPSTQNAEQRERLDRPKGQ